jgi:GTPase SAR1 family protein
MIFFSYFYDSFVLYIKLICIDIILDMTTTKINIPEFDIKSLRPDSTILVIGKRNSGKSCLIKDIFYNHQEIPKAVVFSSTENVNPFFGDFIPDSFIFDEYSDKKVERILNTQKTIVKKARTKGIGDFGKTPENNIAIVLDDCMHDATAWKKCKTIKNIFFNGRHSNIFFLLSLQYIRAIPPDLRGNIDYAFVYYIPSITDKKKIFEDYGNIIPDFNSFVNILDQCTQDFGCLVFKTSGRCTVSWYKAKLQGDFKVGKDTMWKYHYENYNKSHDKDTSLKQKELLELTEKYRNTKNLKVVVSKQSGKIKAIHNN